MTSREIDKLPDLVSWGRFAPVAANPALIAESEKIWEFNLNGEPLMYAGFKNVRHIYPGLYLWMLPTVLFDLKPLAGFRATRVALDKHMREEGQNVWCIVDPTVQGCVKLIELLGFVPLGFTYEQSKLIYGKDL